MKQIFIIIFIVIVCFSEQYTYGKLKKHSRKTKLSSCHYAKVIKKKDYIKQINANKPVVSNSSVVSTSQISATKQGPCSCGGGVCGCCSRLLFNVWKQTACVRVSYDPDEFSFTAKVLMNDILLYTRTVSGN